MRSKCRWWKSSWCPWLSWRCQCPDELALALCRCTDRSFLYVFSTFSLLSLLLVARWSLFVDFLWAVLFFVRWRRHDKCLGDKWMWILICSRALFLYRFQPSMTKNADRNPRILIGQRDPSREGFSLKSTLHLRYPCAPHGNHTGTQRFFYKITVRRSKYCQILKLKTGLNFWMTELFV